MASRCIDQLTDAQRASLRLVLKHHNSKEIAVIFGVSPSAIDKRIERAVQVLGVATRFEAARMLDAHERDLPADHVAERAFEDADDTYERLPSEPIDLSPPPSDTPSVGQIEPWGLVRRFLGTTPRIGFEGVARNRLSKGDRLVRLIGIIGLIAITTMAILNMATTVTGLIKQGHARAVPTRGADHSALLGGRYDMLKQRRHAVDMVTADFLKAEASVDQAALHAATCVATLLQQRAAANLPVGTGMVALQMVADASNDIIKARQRFIDAYRALVAVRTDIGLGAIYGYGDEGECPPSEGALKVDTPLRLAAVA